MENLKFEEWQKLDLRVGEILEAKEIEGKDRLYRLFVDIGRKITIVAGIKKYYSKEELEGKKIIVIANLEPAKLGGVLSEGMLLAAGNKETDECVVLTIDKKAKNGTRVS